MAHIYGEDQIRKPFYFSFEDEIRKESKYFKFDYFGIKTSDWIQKKVV